MVRRNRTWSCMFRVNVFTDLSVKLWEWSVAAVHSSTRGQGALRGRRHGLTLGAVASSRQLSAQSAAVLRGRAWETRIYVNTLHPEGLTTPMLLWFWEDLWTPVNNSRMPSPLLALMERPGSARFLVMEGMLTEPLKPARFSWTRTFWF